MKKFVIGVVLFAGAACASAESCVTLDYQEMKDMSKKDLTEEYCRAVKTAGENIQAALDAIQNGRSQKQPTDDAGQCQDQAKRISRALAKKGVKTKGYSDFCKGATEPH